MFHFLVTYTTPQLRRRRRREGPARPWGGGGSARPRGGGGPARPWGGGGPALAGRGGLGGVRAQVPLQPRRLFKDLSANVTLVTNIMRFHVVCQDVGMLKIETAD
ncbi:MAG: hypothetical protein V4708_07605 [Bacteroidota bacterium]